MGDKYNKTHDAHSGLHIFQTEYPQDCMLVILMSRRFVKLH